MAEQYSAAGSLGHADTCIQWGVGFIFNTKAPHKLKNARKNHPQSLGSLTQMCPFLDQCKQHKAAWKVMLYPEDMSGAPAMLVLTLPVGKGTSSAFAGFALTTAPFCAFSTMGITFSRFPYS